MVAGDLETPVLAVVGSSAQASPVDDVVLVALTSGILGVNHKLLAPARRARLNKLCTTMLFDNGTVGSQIEWILAVSQSSPGPAVEASMVSDPTGFLEHHRHENKARSHPGYTGHDMAILRSRDPMRLLRLQQLMSILIL